MFSPKTQKGRTLRSGVRRRVPFPNTSIFYWFLLIVKNDMYIPSIKYCYNQLTITREPHSLPLPRMSSLLKNMMVFFFFVAQKARQLTRNAKPFFDRRISQYFVECDSTKIVVSSRPHAHQLLNNRNQRHPINAALVDDDEG
jgi:hypothetical protein